MSARTLQELVVLAHHGCAFVDVILAGDSITAAERACFAAIDPRAFRGDVERQHRLVAAVIEELPVTCAVAGLDAVYALFHDVEGFGAVVRRRLPVVVHFAARLEAVAGDVARIEGGVARARRRRPRGGGFVRAAGVEVIEVGEHAVHHWQQQRASLGDRPIDVVGSGRRLPRDADDRARVQVLIEPSDGSFALANCSAALAGLLRALEAPTSDAHAVAVAREHGCDDDDEARGLLNDLMVDGLLSHV